MTPQNTTETRSRLKRYLSQYYRAKERQSILRQRLADLQTELRHPSVQVQPVTGTRNKGRRPGGGAATLTLKIGDIEDRIQQQMEIEARSVTEIMDVIDLLPPGSLERDILEYRHIDSDMPGPWRNYITPYLVGVMDEFCNYFTEEVVFVKPTQVGGTEALLNMLGWIISQDPSDTMFVYPSDALAERTSRNRIDPMCRLAAPLRARYRANQSQKLEMRFQGMSLYLTGANSPGDLSSSPIKRLFLDEVDKFPGASKKEADPIKLARERTKTFRNRKICMASTPTLKTGHIWRAKEDADVEKHYFVPCPHCGKYIELKFAQIKFPDEEGMSYADRAELANYVCQECGCIITDQDKPQMLRSGEWRVVRETSKAARKVAFWINTLYSPFVRFSEIAREFLLSKDNPETFQNFVNSWLAEPWEDTKLKTNADMVLERQTELPALVLPKWAKLLTGGVDVQENCLYWTIRAWGDFLTSQCIAHGQALSFLEVEQQMNLRYERDGGGDGMVVQLALIDSGDQTDAVYEFCASNSDWALPSKGSSHAMTGHFKYSVINKPGSSANGMNLVLVDTDKYKDMIAGRMKKPNGTGSWMVHMDCDLDYAEQVTAEHKVNTRVGQRIVQKWEKKSTHAANHYLDCEVYAMCAADMLGARSLHLQTVEPRTEVKQDPAPAEPAADSWLGIGGGQWI